MDGLPAWGDGIGWIFAAIIMLTIVLYPIVQVVLGLMSGRYESFRDAGWRLIRPESNWGPADKELQVQRYTDPEFSEHWKWLPACIKDKERNFKNEFQMEMSHRPKNPHVNKGFQQVDEP